MKFSFAIIIAALAFASVSQGQSTGDVQLPVKSSSGPLEPVWITKTANRAIGWNSSGVLGPIPISGGSGSSDWPDITNKPTTLAGYGITDSITAALAASTYEPIITTGSLALSKLATDPLARVNHTGTQAWSTITGTPTTLSGYGITDAITAALAASTYENKLTFSTGLSRSVNTITLATSGITAGTYGSSSQVARYTIDAYGRITAVTAVTIQPSVNAITGMGTGVSTALSISIGSNGAPVVYNGDAGTPSAINLANATALPLSTGVSGDLSLSNLAQSSAASKLLGRGASSGAGDYQEITLGSGLTMSGTTLSASGSSFDPASPGAIGGTTPAAGTFTSVTTGGAAIYGAEYGSLSIPLLALGSGGFSLYGSPWVRNTIESNGTGRFVFRSGGGEGFEFNNGPVKLAKITTPPAVTNAAQIYSKDVAGTAEAFVQDEAGNETQISPHSRIAPESMYDSPFDEVHWSANYYTGIITFTNQRRLAEGQADSKFYETFEEHVTRMGDDCDPMVKAGIWDWGTVKKAEADKSQEEHDLWLERKTKWLAAPENAGKPFAEREPKIIIAKPIPKFIADQIAGKAAFLAARPVAGISVKMTSLRLALIDAQLLQPVLNVLEAMPDPVEKLKAKTWWETAQNVTRNHPLVLSLASALGQTPEQVDALFQAAKLKDAAP